MRLDLNADVGESFGPYSMGRDADLMPHITSANVACGFHAGDPSVMRLTVALARKHGVAVGAHPGFPDLQGFGRREVQMSAREVYDLVVYQVGALAAVAATQGMRLQHVKPHGALYNMAARDPLLADAIAGAVAAVGRSLILVGLAGSELLAAAARVGIPSASEVFADRAYRADGTLVPRSQPGSVIDEPDTVVARTVGIARDRVVRATDGTQLTLEADTICVHGDTPGAADLAARIRSALIEAGVSVQSMGKD
jgi:UPF0271 protein